jgi:hypothetical protein
VCGVTKRNLIRHTLADRIRDLSPRLKPALADFGDEFGVDAWDGIGRKTEAPWVRFCNLTMSGAKNARTPCHKPNATGLCAPCWAGAAALLREIARHDQAFAKRLAIRP